MLLTGRHSAVLLLGGLCNLLLELVALIAKKVKIYNIFAYLQIFFLSLHRQTY